MEDVAAPGLRQAGLVHRRNTGCATRRTVGRTTRPSESQRTGIEPCDRAPPHTPGARPSDSRPPGSDHADPSQSPRPIRDVTATRASGPQSARARSRGPSCPAQLDPPSAVAHPPMWVRGAPVRSTQRFDWPDGRWSLVAGWPLTALPGVQGCGHTHMQRSRVARLEPSVAFPSGFPGTHPLAMSLRRRMRGGRRERSVRVQPGYPADPRPAAVGVGAGAAGGDSESGVDG
jgi:hypothetical protein